MAIYHNFFVGVVGPPEASGSAKYIYNFPISRQNRKKPTFGELGDFFVL